MIIPRIRWLATGIVLLAAFLVLGLLVDRTPWRWTKPSRMPCAARIPSPPARSPEWSRTSSAQSSPSWSASP